MFANLQVCVSLLPFVTKTGYLTVMAGVLSALVILLLVAVALFCIHKKKQSNKSKGTKRVFFSLFIN